MILSVTSQELIKKLRQGANITHSLIFIQFGVLLRISNEGPKSFEVESKSKVMLFVGLTLISCECL